MYAFFCFVCVRTHARSVYTVHATCYAKWTQTYCVKPLTYRPTVHGQDFAPVRGMLRHDAQFLQF